MQILGIDIGGTGTKAAIVDIESGTLVTERIKLATPQPATPKNMLATVKELVDKFDWDGQIGVGFPAVVENGICRTATNIDKSWIGVDLKKEFSKFTSGKVTVVNDADAAGLAEYAYGMGKGVEGLFVLITLGTGVGSAFIYNGTLIPNIELGIAPWREGIVEDYVSNRIRKMEDLSWKEWGIELNVFFNYVERIYFPTAIAIGGGVSKKYEKYREYIQLKGKAKIAPAKMLNEAGIVGAAYAALK